MSRSRRKRPFASMTVTGFDRGEKKDKQRANRTLRQKTKQVMAKGDEDRVAIDKKDVSNVYTFRKDGKQRFDPRRHPKMMRK
jgi:hypothetical protein